MALQAEIEDRGLSKPDAYWRIMQLVLVSRGASLTAAFSYDCYASSEAYQEGVRAIVTDTFEVDISSEVSPEMTTAMQNLIAKFSVKELATIAFALGKTFGYREMAKLPQFKGKSLNV